MRFALVPPDFAVELAEWMAEVDGLATHRLSAGPPIVLRARRSD